MRTRQVIILLSLLLLAGHVHNSAAQTRQERTGAGVATVDLDPDPGTEALATARKAFRRGDIVRIVGGAPEDLERLLGVRGGRFVHSPSPDALVFQVVAARATKRGAVHAFVQMAPAAPAGSMDVRAFARWAEDERRLALQEQQGLAVTDPGPQAQAWTQLYKATTSSTTSDGNVFQNTVSIYRLNDVDPALDYYMVLTDPQSKPNYLGCRFNCGWFTQQRVFTVSTTPAAVLVDHGPNNPITNDSGSFTIGANLSANPGANATFTQAWSQPSVVTTDLSDLSKGVGQWNEAFAGQGLFKPPPETSIGTFVSHQGSIFQVPGGTTSFQLAVDAQITSQYNYVGYDLLPTAVAAVHLTVYPPLFAVSVGSLTVPPGGAGTFDVIATNPTGGTSVGLPWKISNIPPWLTASQVSGSASTVLTLSVQPGTPLGSVAFLNVDTDPPFAAPSVEKNPLVVKVTVGQPDDIGTLLTGGVDSVTGTVLDTAALYSPVSHVFDFETTMTEPRAAHTATLLLSGQLLVAGGRGQGNQAIAAAELFDPATRAFASTGSMTAGRLDHSATLLRKGTVLLAGGIQPNASSLASAELFDPITKTFAATGSMGVARGQHSATVLFDGTVLVAGGLTATDPPTITGTAEIYNPATGTFTPIRNGMNVPRYNHTATLLRNGKVLIAGGDAPGASPAVEFYDPASKLFFAIAGRQLNVGRAGHTATLLPDGDVLIAGGRDALRNALASAELFDPSAVRFTLISGALPCPGSPGCLTAPRSAHTATRQLDGTVFLGGGVGPGNQSLGSTEVYDPKSSAFSAGPSTTPRSAHTATLLQRPITVTTLTSSKNPSAAGETIALTAQVALPGGGDVDTWPITGSIAFLDGDTVLAELPLQASDDRTKILSVSSLGIGPHSLTARYSGDTVYGKSTSLPLVQTVTTQTTTTALASSADPSKAGQLVTFTATVTPGASGTPTGVVIFRDDGTELGRVNLQGGRAVYSTSVLEPGRVHAITASYGGDGRFSGSSSAVVSQNVGKWPSAMTLTSSANPSQLGTDVKITATLTSTGGALTGVVAFKDGQSALGNAPVQSGVAVITLPAPSVGVHVITATYAGDSTHQKAIAPALTQVVQGKFPVIVTLTSAPNPSTFGQTVLFKATVTSLGGGTPTGSITLSEGDIIHGSTPISGGVGTLTIKTLAQGRHVIAATYGGDETHKGGTSNTVQQLVLPPRP